MTHEEKLLFGQHLGRFINRSSVSDATLTLLPPLDCGDELLSSTQIRVCIAQCAATFVEHGIDTSIAVAEFRKTGGVIPSLRSLGLHDDDVGTDAPHDVVAVAHTTVALDTLAQDDVLSMAIRGCLRVLERHGYSLQLAVALATELLSQNSTVELEAVRKAACSRGEFVQSTHAHN